MKAVRNIEVDKSDTSSRCNAFVTKQTNICTLEQPRVSGPPEGNFYGTGIIQSTPVFRNALDSCTLKAGISPIIGLDYVDEYENICSIIERDDELPDVLAGSKISLSTGVVV